MKPAVRSTTTHEFACVGCGEHWFRYDHLEPTPGFSTRWFCEDCGACNAIRVVDGCFDVTHDTAEVGTKAHGPPGVAPFPVIVEHWDDLGFTCVMQLINEAVLGVRLWAISGHMSDDPGVRIYGDMGDGLPADFYKVTETIDGGVRFDGCSNWNTMPDGVCQHFCDGDFDAGARAMRRAYERAATMLRSWCGRPVETVAQASATQH